MVLQIGLSVRAGHRRQLHELDKIVNECLLVELRKDRGFAVGQSLHARTVRRQPPSVRIATVNNSNSPVASEASQSTTPSTTQSWWPCGSCRV